MNRTDRQLLIVDDDHLLCDSVREALSDLSVQVVAAHSAVDGLRLCKSKGFDIVLLDQKLPDAQGLDYCAPILNCQDRTKIIFITAYPSFENAVQAIKVGAHDYLSKPFEIGELRLAVTQALRTIDLERVEQVQQYKSKQEGDNTVLVGDRGGLQEVRRLVAATNADLESDIQNGRFREDLFYRLSVVRIHVPALRERIGDLPDLCHYFMGTIAPDLNVALGPDELRAMGAYAWPGNVRELRNVIERAILVREGRQIHPSRLLQARGAVSPTAGSANDKAEIMTLKALEACHIRKVLARLGGNYTHTAKALGISRSTLMRKINTYQNCSESDTVPE
jgi:DNA-binding NtrC family response regulator